MSDSKKVFIFGYSGHSYVIIESLLDAGYNVEGYFDFSEAKTNPFNLTYFGFEGRENVKDIVGNNLVFPTIGDNKIREKLLSLFEANNLNQFVAKDPSAVVSKTATIGLSTYIGKNACMNALAVIGKGSVLNTGAIVEHECKIGDFTHIGPGTVLCGNVEIGHRSFIGANSVVRQNIKINSDITVGAGSTVVKTLDSPSVYFGNPAKQI